MQSAEAKSNFILFLKQNAAKLSLLILLTIMVVFLGRKAKEHVEPGLPELVPRVSVFNMRASGLSGLKELMLLCKLDVQVWTLPYRLLKGKGNCLLIIEPKSEFQSFESKQIVSWVESGNTLLYIDSMGPSSALAKILKVKTAFVKSSGNEKLAIPQDNQSHYFDYVSSINIGAAQYRISGGEPIVGDKHGALLMRCPLGKGQVIIGVLPEFLVNRNFGDKKAWSNMQLIVNICRLSGGSILIDERCHGFTNSENVFAYILKTPFGFACLQVILVLILAILSCLHPFGGVRKLTEAKSKQPKFIEAISNLLLRAKANKAAVSVIAQDTYRHAKHSGVSLEEADWQYLKSAQQLAMVDSKLLKEQVAECDKIRKKIEAIKKKDTL